MKHMSRPSLPVLICALAFSVSWAWAQVLITTVAGTTWVFPAVPLTATNAPLGEIPGVALKSANEVLAVDAGNHFVVLLTLNTGMLTVVAGNGTAGFSGDAGPATSAQLARPSAVALDANGNIYIADRDNHRIRMVTPGGIITTVAGNGVEGYSGDGGLATTAALNNPRGVAVDAAGNLYIADTGNHRIRKVSGGTMATVAGTGIAGLSGDNGPATSAQLNTPIGVAVDRANPANLYIADTGNHSIRKVSGGTVTTVAGTGTAGFSGEGGLATSARLNAPFGVAVDAAGNLYIADRDNGRIRKVNPFGTSIMVVAGTGVEGFSGDGGPATSAQLNGPSSVAVEGANLYIADVINSRVRKVLNGTITTVAGNGLFKFAGDRGPATSASLHRPNAVAVGATTGNIYIADTGNHRIRRVRAGTITTWAGNGMGAFGGDGGLATGASLNSPGGLGVDGAGNLYITDKDNRRIRKVAPDGTISTVAGNGSSGFSGDGGPATAAAFREPQAVTADAAGNFYIADTGNHRIRKVSTGGTITTVAGDGTAGFLDNTPGTAARLNRPQGVALDATAANLYVADTVNHRIRKVPLPAGPVTTVAGTGTAGFSGDDGPAASAQLFFPSGVVADAEGNLYVADTAGSRVRKVTPGGMISTVAGNGIRAFSGDGGPATAASLNSPNGVALDTAGNLLIADTSNDRIRRLSGLTVGAPSAMPVFTAAAITNGASFQAGVSAGSIITIFGTGLTKELSGIVLAERFPLPNELRGVSVTVNGFPAPLYGIANVGGQEQINLQVPYEVTGQRAVTLVVTNNRVPGAPVQVSLLPAHPGVFTVEGTAGAIVHNANFQLVSASNPAAPGEAVAIFATGLGPVSPAPSTGTAASASPLSRIAAPPVVTVGGLDAPVNFSGLAPGFAGLYQVNITVPRNAPSGSLDVIIAAGDQASKAVKMAVR